MKYRRKQSGPTLFRSTPSFQHKFSTHEYYERNIQFSHNFRGQLKVSVVLFRRPILVYLYCPQFSSNQNKLNTYSVVLPIINYTEMGNYLLNLGTIVLLGYCRYMDYEIYTLISW